MYKVRSVVLTFILLGQWDRTYLNAQHVPTGNNLRTCTCIWYPDAVFKQFCAQGLLKTKPQFQSTCLFLSSEHQKTSSSRIKSKTFLLQWQMDTLLSMTSIFSLWVSHSLFSFLQTVSVNLFHPRNYPLGKGMFHHAWNWSFLPPHKYNIYYQSMLLMCQSEHLICTKANSNFLH